MPTDRQNALAHMVAERGFVAVVDASIELDVSTVTIRSDLHALERAGVIRAAEPPVEVSAATGSGDKERIAREAASRVASGMGVLIDVGSTTAAVARAIVARPDLHDVTLITNSLSIALEAEAAIGRFSVVVTGGTLRALQHSLVAPLAGEVLRRVRAEIAFIGCNGISAADGVTNMNLLEAETKRAMMASASRSIVVADGAKIGGVSRAFVGDLDEFDEIITSASAPEAACESIRAATATPLTVVGDRVETF